MRQLSKSHISKSHSTGLRELCEGVGHFIEYWGFKKIQGEIWMFLYASESPVSAQEVQTFFRISRALTHLALGELVSYGLIDRVKQPGKRQAYFKITEDVWSCISHVLDSREKRLIEKAKDAIEAYESVISESINPIVFRRIRFLKHLTNTSLHFLNLLILVASPFSKKMGAQSPSPFPVILSAAKDLVMIKEILRCAQDD